MIDSNLRSSSSQIPGYAPPKGPLIEHQKKLGLWAVKLPSADATVVRRSLSILTNNPRGLQGVNEDPTHADIPRILRYIAVGLLIGLLGRFSLGKWLLLNFPWIFSLGLFKKNGPTDEEIASASFKMWFLGHGFSDASHVSHKPDTEIITRVMGPEIGYVTTPIILLQCALTVLKHRGDLPKGGVFPPGIVFGPTDLQDRLQENGISFDVVSKSYI
ncbi:hypothetical protein Hanom_Chr14g01305421 [Helianthus anomalus]